MPVTIPEDAYAVIQSLIDLPDADFLALVEALKKARPELSPEIFGRNVSKLVPQVKSETIESIVSELFAMG